MPNCATASIIAFCSGFSGGNRLLQSRPKGAQHRRAEHDAGDQLAHDRRLTDPLHQLAEQAAVSIRRTIWATNRSSDGPFETSSAAKVDPASNANRATSAQSHGSRARMVVMALGSHRRLGYALL